MQRYCLFGTSLERGKSSGDGDDGRTAMQMDLMPLIYMPKNVGLIKMVNFILCIFHHDEKIFF